eukprot:GHVO01063309.1.p1 GENE.GHVO01063309.1~~GHVO01063309.1.p1  ORF type:complete len:129 (+),score=19.83 GHVO01063309.1:231-617(+)
MADVQDKERLSRPTPYLQTTTADHNIPPTSPDRHTNPHSAMTAKVSEIHRPYMMYHIYMYHICLPSPPYGTYDAYMYHIPPYHTPSPRHQLLMHRIIHPSVHHGCVYPWSRLNIPHSWIGRICTCVFF